MSKILFISSLCLCSFRPMKLTQEQRIVGKATAAEDGLPLPEVSVVVKGTTKRTVTDASGQYNRVVPTLKGVGLVFSFVGINSQEIQLASQSELNVSMVSDSKLRTEVVVTGSGTETSNDYPFDFYNRCRL